MTIEETDTLIKWIVISLWWTLGVAGIFCSWYFNREERETQWPKE